MGFQKGIGSVSKPEMKEYSRILAFNLLQAGRCIR
jgi:hypothetical protein